MDLSDRIKDILEWIVCIIIAFVLALLIRYFIGTPTTVQQPSMYPTLKSGQRLILNRLTRTMHTMPKRGEIITFEAPTDDSYIYPDEFNPDDVIAKYSNEPASLWGKFKYYVLETGKDSYIKRVIALPGEHIQIKDGKVYINDAELEENYLQPQIATPTQGRAFYDLVVPDSCVFVMGDNRPESTDSRSFGCIPLEKIESKVWIRFWPLDVFGKIDK